ncbi:MAG TPA: hypothetical protein VED19_01225 [Candidatus Nitrosopolaris sp.]|nr:hypothetical protein [Candidatus Nitrosopolaris sp.]
MKPTHCSLIAATCGIILALPFVGKADTSFTITTTSADAFLSAANPTLNFGGAGTLAIAPASSPKGEFDSVIMFNTASAVSQFNTTYGAGNWTITGLELSLASNFGTQGAVPNNGLLNTVSGGSFGIDWLANDSWVEGTGGGNGAANGAVSFNSIASLLSPGYDPLGTYTYTPPGNNVYANYSLPLDANLVSGAAAGGDVSLYFYAADNQIGYLFNSKEFASNHPELTVTATPVPEPVTATLLLTSLGGFLFLRGRTGKK